MTEIKLSAVAYLGFHKGDTFSLETNDYTGAGRGGGGGTNHVFLIEIFGKAKTDFWSNGGHVSPPPPPQLYATGYPYKRFGVYDRYHI